jgi:FtsP/CotA-like multicopper oxidase with cupredoxin domain
MSDSSFSRSRTQMMVAQKCEYYTPEDQPAGTFWFHAHRHGSTAVQVSSGAAGIRLIRGDREYKPPTKDTPHPMADIDTMLHDPKRHAAR